MIIQELIDDIITELAYRTTSGIPDFSNPHHISLLKEVLQDMNIPESSAIIANLTEAPVPKATGEEDDRYDTDDLNQVITYQTKPDDPENSKEKSAVVGDLLKGKQGPGYEAAMRFLGSRGIEVKDDGGVADADKLDPPADWEDGEGGSGADEDDPQGDEEAEKRKRTQAMYADDPEIQTRLDNEKEYQKQQQQDYYAEKEPPEEVSNIFSGSQSSVTKAEPYLSDKDKKMIEEFKTDFKMLADNPDDRELAEKMVEKYGLEVSSGKAPKVYIRNINFEARKYLGQTKETKFIKDTIENALGEELSSSGKGPNIKTELSRVTKPDLETKRTAEEDPHVRKLFEEHPFDTTDQGVRQLFGPVDDDGNLLIPSSEHSRKYLEQSITENTSLDDTIKKLEELEESHNVSPTLRKAVEDHKKTMHDILNNHNVPSPEAAQAVGDSYAKMAQTLNTESPSIASSMMKNIAEMAMYDNEIAAGEEAYLPSHGSFPSGDKIKITRTGGRDGKMERASYVSVKFGKKGEFGSYGFPGQTNQYSQLHPDEDYKDRMGSVPGLDGYEMGVRSDLIEDESKTASIIEESGFEDIIDDIDGFSEIMKANLNGIKQLKEKIGYVEDNQARKERNLPPARQQIVLMKDEIAKIESELSKKLEEVVDDEALEQFMGSDNANIMMKRPSAFFAAMTFSSTLRTADGFPSLEHNHQEFVDGKYVSGIDTHEDGTVNPKLWSMTWRAYDDRSGGLLASFNSNRKKM